MRAVSLFSLLLAFSAVSLSPSAATAAAHEEQVTIKIATIALKKDVPEGAGGPLLDRILREGVVTNEAALNGFRPMLARQVSAGNAAIVESFSLTTVSGVAVRIRHEGGPALAGWVLPRLAGKEVEADLHLIYGRRTGRAYSGQAVSETIKAREGAGAVLRFPDPSGATGGQIVHVQFSRAAP